MNATSEANEPSVTLLEWLDAVARGQTPLPRYAIMKTPRFLRPVRIVLAWVLTLATIVVLAIGTLYSGAFIASLYYVYPAIGFWIWHFTMLAVAVLGVLAFLCAGRLLDSVKYAAASLVVNYCYLWSQFGLAFLEPLLMIPPAVLLNGGYAYAFWRFVLSPRIGEEHGHPDRA